MGLRLLSPLNQIYRNLAMLTSANSCEWISLSQPLDLKLLREAAEAVVRMHPVLNSVQLRRGLFFYWKELDTPVEVDIRYERLPALTEEALHPRLVANIHAEPLPITRHRPLRLHVTELDDGRTWLQIITTHVFTDGRSANVVARDLAHAYGTVSAGMWPAQPVSPASRDPFDLFTRHLSFGQRWRLGWQGLKAIFSDLFSRVVALKLPGRPRGETRISFFDLGSAKWSELRAHARAQGLSVHPFIVAAVLRVIETLNRRNGIESPVIRLIDNFSLRRFAAQPEQLADLYDVYAVPYTIDFQMSPDSRELVQRIRGKLDALKAGGILAELYRNWHYRNSALLSDKKIGTRLVTRFVMKSNVICTNIGPVPEDFSRFGEAQVLDYYSFSQMFPPGQLMFLFSTYRNRLRLVLLHDGNNIEAALASEIGTSLFPAALAAAIHESRVEQPAAAPHLAPLSIER